MWDFVVPLILFFLFPDNFMPSATILFGNTLYDLAASRLTTH